MINENTQVTIAELELCLGLSKQRIGQLKVDGVIVKAGHGKYLLAETLKNYHQYLKGVVADSGGADVIDFNYERARKTRAEASRIERLNEVDNGLYVALADVKAEISDAAAICSRILTGMKLKISRIAPDMSNRTLDLIDRECLIAMTAICELDESYLSREPKAAVISGEAG